MNILTVADFFHPDVVGGSSIVIDEIMRRLVGRGHHVTVLTRSTHKSIRKYGEIEVRTYAVPTAEFKYPLAVARCLKAIREIMGLRKYDLINSHHAFSGFAVELSRRLSRRAVPSVFYFHGPWYKEALAKDRVVLVDGQGPMDGLPLKYRFRRGIERSILKSCTAIVGLSDYMLREANDIYPGIAFKFRKVPGGVDIDRFTPHADKRGLAKELGLPEDKTILLTIRRLSPRMGLENLVRAMAIVAEERDDVHLVIGGGGELQGDLQRLSEGLKLGNITLTGFIDGEILPSYYQASDLFVMPSLTLEGFGLSTLEAMACGVPVLGTPTGGTPEILQPVLPDFILGGVEPADIAAGILARMGDLQDPELRARVRGYAQGFSWEGITDSVEGLFRELADPDPMSGR